MIGFFKRKADKKKQLAAVEKVVKDQDKALRRLRRNLRKEHSARMQKLLAEALPRFEEEPQK